LDQATQRKLTRLLRASPALRQSAVFPLPVCRPGSGGLLADSATTTTTAAATSVDGSTSVSSGGATVGTAGGSARSTLVPAGIKHYTVSMDKSQATADPLKLLRAAAKELLAGAASEAAAAANRPGLSGDAAAVAAPGIGLVVLCSSLPLKVRVVSRELSNLGFECVGLSDALWPEATRSLKGQSRAYKAKAPSSAAGNGQAAGSKGEKEDDDDDDDEAEDDADERESDAQLVTLERRAALCSSLASTGVAPPASSPPKAPLMKLVVTDQARARGLHLDDVTAVFVLGGAANADTYLHLAGRTGRMSPRASAAAAAATASSSHVLRGVCVTIALPADVKRVRAWAAELGGVEFQTLALEKAKAHEKAK
jgi:hypothetical protein